MPSSISLSARSSSRETIRGTVGSLLTTQFAAPGVTIRGGACTNGELTGSFFTSQQFTNFQGDGTVACGASGCPSYQPLTFTFTNAITYFGVQSVVSNGDVNLDFATPMARWPSRRGGSAARSDGAARDAETGALTGARLFLHDHVAMTWVRVR